MRARGGPAGTPRGSRSAPRREPGRSDGARFVLALTGTTGHAIELFHPSRLPGGAAGTRETPEAPQAEAPQAPEGGQP